MFAHQNFLKASRLRPVKTSKETEKCRCESFVIVEMIVYDRNVQTMSFLQQQNQF